MKKYVLGFAFWDDNVILIRKSHPSWQKGSYNGLGGELNQDETPMHAMSRTFEKECGVSTASSEWNHFCTIQKLVGNLENQFILHCFWIRFPACPIYRTLSDEAVIMINIDYLDRYMLVDNVSWLIALARSANIPNSIICDYL